MRGFILRPGFSIFRHRYLRTIVAIRVSLLPVLWKREEEFLDGGALLFSWKLSFRRISCFVGESCFSIIDSKYASKGFYFGASLNFYFWKNLKLGCNCYSCRFKRKLYQTDYVVCIMNSLLVV